MASTALSFRTAGDRPMRPDALRKPTKTDTLRARAFALRVKGSRNALTLPLSYRRTAIAVCRRGA